MADMILKVKTEQLMTAASEVDRQVNKLRKHFQQIDTIVKRSSSYWEGNGQQAYYRVYQHKYSNIESALQHISQNADSLRTIAGVYTATEAEITEEIGILSDDVII